MKAWVLARREWRVAFDTPIAYVVLALFPALTAAFFLLMGPFFAQRQASLRGFFALLPMLFILVVPATTMRLWAEERRSGTEEILHTYPFRVRDLVLGKFLGAWGLVFSALVLTLGIPLAVASLGPLDWGPVWGGYFGSMLLGAACVAIGLFCSACCRNQIVAWILGALVILLFNLCGSAAVAAAMPKGLAALLLQMDFGRRFESLHRGVIALPDVVFFVALTALFLIANGLVVETRRWRS
ncbi:MAG: hypothetical protein DWQ01_02700 [Planctomycetota bacterium]|nr:MAG: hypothetical protein DWQ01_02700 [Planctomycetota bacterium]